MADLSGIFHVILFALSAVVEAQKSCSGNCDQPLGIADGRITDQQMTASSAYNGDFATYGAHRARLALKSHAPGYRADPASFGENSKPWVTVDLGKNMIITGIATQGYGVELAQEWVKSYVVLYTNGGLTEAVKNTSGVHAMVFLGNNDTSSVQRHAFPVPVIASNVTVVPHEWNNNVGLRMELFGCEPGYHLVLWLLVENEPFTLQLANAATRRYREMNDTVMKEIYGILSDSPGFLSAELQRFGPQSLSFVHNETFLMAEFKLFCVKAAAGSLAAKLQTSINDSQTIFYSGYMDKLDPFDCTCPHAAVDVNLGKTLDHAKVIPATERIVIKATVTHTNCSSLSNVEGYWDITRATVTSEVFLHFVPSGRQTKKPTFSMSRKFKFDSYYYARYILRLLPDYRLIGADYGFFYHLIPPPVATISGVALALKGNGNVTLNGSKSYDPLSGNAAKLTFSWFCRRNNESFAMSLSSPVVDFPSENSTTSGGCYGYGAGRLSSTKPNLEVYVDKMEGGETYVFELVVTNAQIFKNSTAVHSLKVQMKTPDFFTIRCTYNCGPKVVTSKRMIIESNCTGPICKSISSYSWTLFKSDPSNSNDPWTEIPDLPDRILTELDNPSVVLAGDLDAQEGTLEKNTSYKIKGSVHLEGGNVAEDEIVFQTIVPLSRPTENERCSIKPIEGLALETEFAVNCSGWHILNPSLTYSFSFMSPAGLVIIKSGSSSPFLRTVLPQGDPSQDYNVNIRVDIHQTHGDSQMEFFTAMVKPVSNTTSVHIMKVRQYMDAGNVSEAAYLATVMLGSVRQNMHKDTILYAVAGVNITQLTEVNQLSVVAIMAIEKRENISLESLEDAARLLKTATGFLGKHNLDRDSVQLAGGFLLRALSILLSASSGKAAETYRHQMDLQGNQLRSSSRKRRDVMKGLQQVKDLTRGTLRLVDQLGTTLLSTKMTGEKSSTFKADLITMTVDRQVPSKVGGKTLRPSKEVGAVSFPSSEILFEKNMTDLPSVDTQVLIIEENPYVWTNVSKNIKTSVVSIDLKTREGSLLNISRIKDPVEMYIPDKRLSKNMQNESSRHFFVKPFNDSNPIRYHKIVIDKEFESAFVELIPQNDTILEVFVSAAARPSVGNYSLTTRVPNGSSCESYKNGMGYFNCTRNPYLFSFSSAETGHVGVHFVGIRRAEPAGKLPLSKQLKRQAHSLRACRNSNGRQKRSCVGVKHLPTTPPPKPEVILLKYNESTDVNYTLFVVMKSCLYWSEVRQVWTSEGCKAGSKTVQGHLQCLCTHLSAFGGNIFVAPNPIDFDKVWIEFERLAKSGNVVVLCAVCLIFGIYFVALIFTRRADKQDRTKVVANTYLDDSIMGGYCYGINIQTGMWKGSGTSACVGIILNGEHGTSGPVILTDHLAPRKFFARGSVNNFTLTLPASLGKLNDIQIWHDNKGSDPAWYLHQVVVADQQTKEEWYFFVNQWLALDSRSGVISLDIKAAIGKELTAFKPLFFARTARSLGNEHIWISVFTKAPHNPFTRCQRLSCCLSFLFSAMVTNAMFYQFSEEPTDTFKFGPLVMSWTQIKIGLQSSMIAIPINVLIVMMFKHAKHGHSNDKFLNEDHNDRTSKAAGLLPHFCVYIAWILCFLISFTSATFTVFYSLMWGAAVSNKWLTSILVSVVQDVLVTQPIKVVALAALLSLLIKKLPEQEKVVGAPFFKSRNEETQAPVSNPTQGEELAKEKTLSRNKWNMIAALKEIISFLIFAFLVVVICYGVQDSSRYPTTKAINDVFSGFERVVGTSSFWDWIDKVAVTGLYDAAWYNGEPFEFQEGFISNRHGFMIGMPRLRQLRIRTGEKCDLKHLSVNFSANFARCLPTYSAVVEYRIPLNMPQWIPITNQSQVSNIDDVCPKPWRYQTNRETQTLSHAGIIESYGGGGYVADLGYNKESALEVTSELKANDWIDDLTAAVFIEFTVFNPSSSLFSVVRGVFERLSIGVALTTIDVKTFALYPSSDVYFQSFYKACQILFLVFIIVCFVAEIIKFFREQSYLGQLWNWIELLLLATSFVAVAMSFMKGKYTSMYVKEIQRNPYETFSSDYIVKWTDHEIFWLSLTIFILTLKLLRLIRFNHHICQMQGTLQRSAKAVLSFSLVFGMVVVAFAHFGVLCFGPTMPVFWSFFQSLRVLLQMSIGRKIDYVRLALQYPNWGPIFLFFFLNCINFVLINVFVAILVDQYNDIRLESGKEFDDAKLGTFMFHVIADRCKQLPGVKQLFNKLNRSILAEKGVDDCLESNDLKNVFTENHDDIFLELFEQDVKLPVVSPIDRRLSIERFNNGRNELDEDKEKDVLLEIKTSCAEVAAELKSLLGSLST